MSATKFVKARYVFPNRSKVEAAQRYTDTSWQIFHTGQRKTPSPSVKDNQIQTDDSGIYSQIEPANGAPRGPVPSPRPSKQQADNRHIVHVEKVEVTYEPTVNNNKVEVVLHSHDEGTLRHGHLNKMITSNSYNGFGEALTTQPRLSKNNTNSSGGMDLSYVTERIISLWFSPSTTTRGYKQGQQHVSQMLRNKHGDNYKIFNLSEPKRALRNAHKHVKEVGWALNLAPPLERLCSVCKDIENWLNEDEHRIAVLHARGSKEKLGVIVAAYMHYSSICGSQEQALDRFSMRRFLDDNVGPLVLPSNKRYVEYFAGLLSHHIKINSAPLYLTHVTVVGTPAFQQGGCRAFLKLYEGHTPVYTSGIYMVSNNVSQFTVNVAGERRGGLQLRGDILIKCYHRTDRGRETIFACQFHTCAISDHTLSFTRQELDTACNDPRFPVDGAVELHFSGPEGRQTLPAPTPAVPFTISDDHITRADSPLLIEECEDEDSDSDDVNHTFGPLDGSIYATIAKKPELSPGAVSSPLTVSMDSGISSAGHQQNANTTASASPPPTAQPSPLSPEEQHRELDELLSDMMLTVQSIPDLKPHQDQSNGGPASDNNFGLDNVQYIDEEEDKNIPYHARQDSRPFSYGVNSNMINESKGLSSPSLVRKASINKSSGDTLRKVQTQVYPDFNAKPVPDFSASNQYSPSNYSTLSSKYSSYTPVHGTLRKKDPIDDIFTSSALSAQPIKREFREEYYKDETRRYDPLKRSLTDSTLRRSPEKITYKSSNSAVTSPYSDSESLSPPGAFRNSTKSPEFHESFTTNGNLTWLQKQQQKLKERREVKLREERQPHETQLMRELRNVQTRHMRPSASHRADGYTSDTTAFADDDDDYTVPLHINTMQKNGGSSNYSTLKSTYSSTVKERPFMKIKREHEHYAQSTESPRTILAQNPMGQIVRAPSRGADTVDSGLLSLVEQEQYSKQSSPRYTPGLYREESIQSWRSQSVNDETSPSHSSSPRPQTPAFPVHARTPYLNASTPTVQFDLPSERLPPKSPTTQRRLSCPTPNKLTKKWSLSPERKDRPTSPSDLTNGSASEYTHTATHRSVSSSGFSDGSYQQSPKTPNYNGSASPTIYYGNSRRNSVGSNNEAPHEVAAAHVEFVRDTSKFWYKASISREEAINMLRNQAPGTFVVRDSNSFPGAFGLALRVAQVPSNVQNKSYSSDELIRHFLIEPTSRGVRLKGCPNEPVFSSLSALVYQHSITQMALPCRLVLPESDLKYTKNVNNPNQVLFTQGAACNVLYLFSMDMESLTGPEAIKKSVLTLLQKAPLPETATVHFKVNGQGITLTDNKRKLFFRKHYPMNTVSYCGLDPEDHKWTVALDDNPIKSSNRIFGFVARKPNVSNSDNQCHLFAELEPEQPATAIVNFVNKILTSSGYKPNMV
ncbi:tensin-1 isoform X5 [Aethina tumida]|uniref:tensin-1 isoform X5 n=1 Tax=Aethina tumida TaxID=116153 RepID=UPI0021483AE3|nr:tensin-1 isoform X5 [Aethina tumida]